RTRAPARNGKSINRVYRRIRPAATLLTAPVTVTVHTLSSVESGSSLNRSTHSPDRVRLGTDRGVLYPTLLDKTTELAPTQLWLITATAAGNIPPGVVIVKVAVVLVDRATSPGSSVLILLAGYSASSSDNETAETRTTSFSGDPT